MPMINVSIEKLFGHRKLLNYFALEGHKTVDGWLSSHTLAFLYHLSKFQKTHSIHGNIAEIGVFHGRFFIALCLMLDKNERAAAIDVFDDQQLNIDHSGTGDYDKFCHNLQTHLGLSWHQNVTIIKSDSLAIRSSDLLESMGGNKIRIFSIDGCHTATHTASDLRLATESIQDGSIVILDDFENPAWPGVEQGLMEYLHHAGTLLPFALAYNKLYLTTTSHYSEYRNYAEQIAKYSVDQISHITIGAFEVARVLLPPVESLFIDNFNRYLDFSSSAHPDKYLRSGWAPPESWGTWSQEDNADLIIPIAFEDKGMTMIITFHAFVAKAHPTTEIDFHINGQLVETITFSCGQDYQNWAYQLTDADTLGRNQLHLAFTIRTPRSPLELGLSPDQRRLGIGIRSIRFMGKIHE